MAQTNEELRKKMAVALSYEPEEGAPKIVASGEGYVAQKIEETAKANDVPLYEDSKLAKTLLKLTPTEIVSPISFLTLSLIS